MAGHALYGMAPCFGHTGVTFDAENDRPGPGSLQGHFEATRGRFCSFFKCFSLLFRYFFVIKFYVLNIFSRSINTHTGNYG